MTGAPHIPWPSVSHKAEMKLEQLPTSSQLAGPAAQEGGERITEIHLLVVLHAPAINPIVFLLLDAMCVLTSIPREYSTCCAIAMMQGCLAISQQTPS